MPQSAGVERSKTSYAPVTNTQDFGFTSPKMTQSVSPGVARNNTQITPTRPSPNATIGGQSQVRGLSIRRLGATPNNAPSSAKGACLK